MKSKLTLIAVCHLLSAICFSAFAQGTAFTYQGRLNAGGNPANGNYDIAFTLFATNTSGVAIAGPVTNTATAVSNGLFTTTIDFGAGIFTGGSNWLEIGVRTNGAGAFTTLAPRQAVTPTPYSIFAGTAAKATSLAAPPGMALIPAGSFTIGNSIGDGDIVDANPTNVYVSAFYMDVNLVSLGLWQSVYYWATNNGYNFDYPGSGKAPNNPVVKLDWYDVVKWCNARSERSGMTAVYYTDGSQATVYRTGDIDLTNGCVKWTATGYRLPTEAEWEKAARGGASGQRFPWGNVISENLANYYSYPYLGVTYDAGPNGYNSIGSAGGTSPATSPVGYFSANGYGLYDMTGNVLEWCWDWYAPPPYPPGSPYLGGTDPRGPASGSNRLCQGGHWYTSANFCRTAYRGNFIPSNDDFTGEFGFRCVLPSSQ